MEARRPDAAGHDGHAADGGDQMTTLPDDELAAAGAESSRPVPTASRQGPAAMLVLRCDAARDRHGRPYLRLTLQTTDGAALDAR